MPSTRRWTAGGKSTGSAPGASGGPRGREWLAAERAARKRAETRRRLVLPGAAVVAVLGVVGAIIGVSRSTAHPAATETRAASVIVQQATAVPLGVLTRVSPGQAGTPLQQVAAPSPPLTADGKPVIVFVSEESCPFCAAERWPLVVALSHFGTWSNLGSTRSSPTDVYPNTATFSFRAAHYSSARIALRTTELADNTGRALQPETPLDAKLISAYDVPPFVNSADQSGAVPFLDIANHYILAGAQYNPQILAGLSAAQIAGQLRNPSSPVAQAIDGSARSIIMAINQVLNGTPTGGASRT